MYLILGFVPNDVNEPEGMVVNTYSKLSFRSAVSREESAVLPAEADSSPINRLGMTMVRDAFTKLDHLPGASSRHALAASDVRLAFMKAADDACANPKGTLEPGLYLVATPIG